MWTDIPATKHTASCTQGYIFQDSRTLRRNQGIGMFLLEHNSVNV